MEDKFFVGYSREYLDSPLEDSYGYATDYGFTIIPVPIEQDWESNFIYDIQGEEPVIANVEIAGHLDNANDLNDLLEWLDYRRLSLGTVYVKAIEDAKRRLENNVEEETVWEDADISALLDGAPTALEALSATEGPIKDAIKGAIQKTKLGQKVSLGAANKEGAPAAIFDVSKGYIEAALGGSKIRESVIPLAQIAVYLVNALMSGEKDVNCFALLQNPVGVRKTVDLVAEIPAEIKSGLANIASAAATARQQNQDFIMDKQTEKAVSSYKTTILSKLTAAVNSAKSALNPGAVVVGYTQDVDTANNLWTKNGEQSSAEDNLTDVNWADMAKRKQLNKSWQALKTDPAGQSNMLEKLIPKDIKAARSTFKVYFSTLDEPFTNWAWDLMLSQADGGHDPTVQAAKFALAPNKQPILIKYIGKDYEGLNLSLGSFEKGSANLPQLLVIFTVAKKNASLLPKLKTGSAWLPQPKMADLMNKNTKAGKKFVEELLGEGNGAAGEPKKRGSGSAVSTSLTYAQAKKLWQALDQVGYSQAETASPDEFMELFKTAIKEL